jgi:hypothetical protein
MEIYPFALGGLVRGADEQLQKFLSPSRMGMKER